MTLEFAEGRRGMQKSIKAEPSNVKYASGDIRIKRAQRLRNTRTNVPPFAFLKSGNHSLWRIWSLWSLEFLKFLVILILTTWNMKLFSKYDFQRKFARETLIYAVVNRCYFPLIFTMYIRGEWRGGACPSPPNLPGHHVIPNVIPCHVSPSLSCTLTQ